MATIAPADLRQRHRRRRPLFLACEAGCAAPDNLRLAAWSALPDAIATATTPVQSVAKLRRLLPSMDLEVSRISRFVKTISVAEKTPNVYTSRMRWKLLIGAVPLLCWVLQDPAAFAAQVFGFWRGPVVQNNPPPTEFVVARWRY